LRSSKLARLALALVLAAAGAKAAAAAPALAAVAAENFYADVVGQIGGPRLAVTSVLANPNQDPHAFEATPSTARAIADAALVVYNGAGYDPWMAKLLAAAPSAQRVIVVAADLVGAKSGANPHLWYNPDTMPAVAAAVAAGLERLDPAHAADYRRRLAAFRESLQPLAARIGVIRARYAGTPVTATEPVFGDMAAALGLDMRNRRFQIATMNETEPSARDVAAIEDDLRTRRVRLLVHNSQITDRLSARLVMLARRGGVPVLGVPETAPAGRRYQRWMLEILDAVDHALAATPR
jgi:zinc/manganese transport system substrate-binding protein